MPKDNAGVKTHRKKPYYRRTKMFALGVFKRLLRNRQQQQQVVLHAHDVLTPKQITAGTRALRLLKLSNSLECLTRDDMMNFLYSVGMNPTPDVLDGKLRLLRLQKHDAFSWGELAHVWSMLLHDAANEEQILERAFNFFDKDGNGEISVSELRTTMSELGNLLTEDEICAFIAIMDVNNDGVIGYQEFLETLRTEVPEFAKARSTREELELKQLSLREAAAAAVAAAAAEAAAAHHSLAGCSSSWASPRMLHPHPPGSLAAAATAAAARGTGRRSAAALGEEEEHAQEHGQEDAAATTAAPPPAAAAAEVASQGAHNFCHTHSQERQQQGWHSSAGSQQHVEPPL